MSEPLQLWQQTPTRQAILKFVNAVTTPNSPDFIPPEERIAVFDNDGTLWCEKPMYIQFDYLLRKLAAQAEQDPALREKQPWQAAWEQDYAWLGGAITKHYQGDDSGLQVVLSGVVSLSKDQPAELVEAEAAEQAAGEATDAAIASRSSSQEATPDLTVSIPGLKFSSTTTRVEGQYRIIEIPWMAEYINSHQRCYIIRR